MFLTSSIERFYTWLTFGSIAPLLRRSSKGEVNQDDFLSTLDEHEFSEKTGGFVKEIRENKAAGRWYIIRRMMMGCRRYYAVSFFISFIVTVLMLTVPVQLNVLLKQIEETNLSWTLAMFSIAALVCTLIIRGLLFSHGNLLMQRINIIVMRMLTNALLVKIMRIGGKTLDDGESGKIQTLINDDVKNIALYPTILFGLFLTVIQLIALSSMLFWQLGLVALAGILCLVGMLILQSVLMRYLHTNLQVSRQFRDQRVSVISELFKKFRAIRMSGHTDRFKNHIHEIRESEIKPLFRAAVIHMFMQFIMLSTPLLLSIVTFSLYLWQGEKLTIATVFSVIALFSMLRTPMMALSSIVYEASWASIALNRMHDFLHRDESHVDLEGEQLEPGTIKLQKVSLAHQQQCVLSDVTLAINAGELIGIYGATGSGKTALLNLIAGYEGGFLGEIRRAGKISHLEHHVWLANDTLRNNVLFGEAFDEIRYREVLNMCQLSQDLDSFPAGDNTLVGELGTRLSGGQRQRVALARALYSNSDILMLDNPMSALDPRVAEKIFAQSILPNRGQTRILITNDLALIAQCDRAFELKDSHLHSLVLDTIEQEAPYKIELEQDVQEVVSDDVESYDEEKVETGKIEWPLLKEILRLSGHGGVLLLTIFLLAIVEALRLGSELWLATNVSKDNVAIDSVINIYWGIGALAIGSIFLSQLLIITRIINHTRISHKTMLERVIGAPMAFFDSNPQGRIINRFCVDIETCSGELIANSATAITIAFTLLTQVIYISWQMPFFIGVVVVIVLIYVQMQRRYRVSARAIRRIQSVIRSPLYSSVSEAIRGAPALRLNKKEAYATEQVMYHFERNMQGLVTSSVLTNWLSLCQSLLAAIITGVVAIMAIISGGGALGALAITYALLASNSIANLIGAIALVEGDMNSARRVGEYCLLEQEISKNNSDKSTVDEGMIEFKKVKLRYVKGQVDVLSDISFSVKAGEKVGICGRSGAGKSSIFNLLLGLYPHTGGYIHLGGIDATEINPETRRRLMSTVTQTPLTFSASLRENLDPENLHSEKNISKVLEETGLIRRVMELLQGLDTNIDVARLSAGEIQQLVLGRTLLENRPIVLLDEATADMDTSLMTQMAQKLYSAKPRASFILIAHHLLPLMDMDRVIVIEQGEIVEQGSPIELLKNYDSRFYALFKAQASEYKIA